MTFTEAQKESIKNYLGVPRSNAGAYLTDLHDIENALEADYSSEFVEYIDNLLTNLESVDTLLKNLLADSMAVKTKYVELDYVQQRNLCYQQAHGYLVELANVLQVRIIYNKYPTFQTSSIAY